MDRKVDINIAGYALTVRTDRSAEHMKRLADELNTRVRGIQKSGGTANYLNVVMLAAMELADDVLIFEEKLREARLQVESLVKERDELKERLEQGSRGLLAALEEALK